MTNISQRIAEELNVNTVQVQAAVDMLDEGATVPFIARYRKEATGGLDDTQLRTLEDRLRYLRELEDRRDTILKSISDQDKLTEKLEAAIRAADTKTTLEDLYLPYKQKRRTKAQIAKEAGLEPLADTLFADPTQTPEELAKTYIDADKGVADTKAALDGAKYILMEQFSENAELLGNVRTFLANDGNISAKVVEGKEDSGAKFRDYFEHNEALKDAPSHRALAIFRGRNEGVLQINIGVEQDEAPSRHPCEDMIAQHFDIRNEDRPADKWLNEVVRWTWRVKLLVSMESELLGQLRERAEEEAIRVFANNLNDLLMAAPAGPKATLGLDPGIRTGVKVAVVDATGKFVDHTTIYPHQPKNQWDQSIETLAQLCKKHNIELISIGNGTASRETDKLAADLMKRYSDLPLQKITVNEAGASIYSASEFAAREFPNLDVTIRGAVSIARRLQDPLAELVKIEPKSIGVGQYQHDVSQSRLARSLDAVIEDCVNAVGVDVNTASEPLLARISGLNKTIAGNIVNFRDSNGAFTNRTELKKVPRLGDKTFEQSAGFLRIMDGTNALDRSSVHPEAYPLVKAIADKNNRNVNQMVGEAGFLGALTAKDYTNDTFGLPTVTDIISELEKPGRDPRPEFRTAEFKEGVEEIKDLEPGMILEGSVTNVTNFGAFVDVGVHQDGLVHISVLSNQFVKDPREVVKAGDIVRVKVVDVDLPRKRIALTMRLNDQAGEKVTGGQDRRPKQASRKGKGSNAPRPSSSNKGKSQELPAGKTGTFADLFANANKLKSK
ncbi:RNA-binding transcriptional accessory protein [Gammaproteobacteria bacterium 45_16_T64]|nr:RNA-binding transcriptional accessory protein [Gammaproteobacteria bacterium 45_16_T64]